MPRGHEAAERSVCRNSRRRPKRPQHPPNPRPTLTRTTRPTSRRHRRRRVASPPDFYLCTRYDGTRYISDTGEGGSALVPLGVLGVPGRSLADAYSPQNSIGVSAPGLRQIPRVPAGSVPFGGMSTWIYDECHAAGPRRSMRLSALVAQRRTLQIDKVIQRHDAGAQAAGSGYPQAHARLLM